MLQRHGISRLPDVEGDKPKRQRFKRYPISFFHMGIAEVQTECKLYLFVGIDRTSEFAVTQLVDKAYRRTAWEFLEALSSGVADALAAVSSKLVTRARVATIIAARQPLCRTVMVLKLEPEPLAHPERVEGMLRQTTSPIVARIEVWFSDTGLSSAARRARLRRRLQASVLNRPGFVGGSNS